MLTSLEEKTRMQTLAFEKIWAEDKAKNKQIALALGQRTFDVSKERLMKAFITAFSNKNLTVINMDKGLGFIVAEGGQFIDATRVRQLVTAGRIARLNKASYPGANYTHLAGVICPMALRSTVNLFEKRENRTTVKLGFNPGSRIACSELLPVWYEEMWAEIEQAIFIQRETVE